MRTCAQLKGAGPDASSRRRLDRNDRETAGALFDELCELAERDRQTRALVAELQRVLEEATEV